MITISRFLERRRLRNLRPIMRAYQMLRADGQLARLARVREALTTLRLPRIPRRTSRIIFGAGRESAELVARQFLLSRFGNLSLNRALLASIGRGAATVHPMPPEWRDTLEQHGFAVNRARSAVVWNAYLLLYLAYGMYAIGRRTLAGIHASLRPPAPLGRHVYFDSLTAGNLPQPAPDGCSHDVITWYQEWAGRFHDLDALCHGIPNGESSKVYGAKVVYSPAIVPPPQGWVAVARFVAWSTAASVVALSGLLSGRWWHALLLREASAAAAMRLQRPDRLAREYLFHNSAWTYRPLWTYEAERMGSRISLYFYSANCEAFKQQEEYPPIVYGYAGMNWPHYLVWDEYQASFVRRAVGGSARVSVVGPIWFEAGPVTIPPLPERTIAVFDVQPMRNSYYQTLGQELEYYLPGTSEKFLADIAAAAHDLCAHVAFKRKREVGKLAHPQYRRFVERFHSQRHIIGIPPLASASRVIEQSAAVLSMPLTSTALIARHLGKPSAYYDPTGRLHRDDRAAHGITILREPSELRSWLAVALDQRWIPAPGVGESLKS